MAFSGALEAVGQPNGYKIMKGIDWGDSQNLFVRVEISNTGGCNFKMRGRMFKVDLRFFLITPQNGEYLEALQWKT